MKKIPSLFVRDWEGDHKALPEITPGCDWVLSEISTVIATLKWDGTCVMFRGGQMFKRFDRKRPHHTKPWKVPPEGWEACNPEPASDSKTKHWTGWTPVTSDKGDQWHRAALAAALVHGFPEDGTYELCGPGINSNPEGFATLVLIPHGNRVVNPWAFWNVLPTLGSTAHAAIRRWLQVNVCEGVVFRHPDGRMCKVKRSDFGIPWGIR